MKARKAAIAAGVTAVSLGALGGIALGTESHSNAGKAFASKPIVVTKVTTTHKVVHIKSKPKRVVVASTGTSSPSNVSYAAAVPVAAATGASGTTSRKPVAAAPTGTTWEREQGDSQEGHDGGDWNQQDGHDDGQAESDD